MEPDEEAPAVTGPRKKSPAGPRRMQFNCPELDPLSQVAILVCSPTPPHEPVFINDRVSALLGRESKDIVGNSSFWMNTIHAEDRPQLLSGFFHICSRGYHIYDYRFLRADGACKRLLVELHLHRRRGKEPIAMICFLREPALTDGKLPPASSDKDFIGSDISARLVLDKGLRIREADARMHALCGLRPEELVGRPALELVPPDYSHLAQDMFDRIDGRDSRTVCCWHAIQHRDNSLRFIAAECAGRYGDDEDGIVVKFRDITDLVVLDPKSRSRCTTRLLSTLSRGNGLPGLGGLAEPLERLTEREREILYLTIEGLSSTEIGERLAISPRTVEAHRSHIMNKFGVHSLSQLIRYTVSCIAYPEAD